MPNGDVVDIDRIQRPNYHGPRTLGEWFDHLREDTAKAAFIDAENDAVFVAWDVDEEMWRSNSTDPDSGNRGRGYAHENLVTRWFEEGLETDSVWPMERSEVPV